MAKMVERPLRNPCLSGGVGSDPGLSPFTSKGNPYLMVTL